MGDLDYLEVTSTLIMSASMISYFYRGVGVYTQLREKYPEMAKKSQTPLIKIAFIGAISCFIRMLFSAVTDFPSSSKAESL